MKKRVLAMLLAAVMVAAMLPTAFAVDAPPPGTYGPYTISGTTFGEYAYTISFGAAKVEQKAVQLRRFVGVSQSYGPYGEKTITFVTIRPDTTVTVSGGYGGEVLVFSTIADGNDRYTYMFSGAAETLRSCVGAGIYDGLFGTREGFVLLDDAYLIVVDASAPIKPEKPTGFTDVPAGIWYVDAVNWAVENNITSGTGDNTFTPDRVCTHGEIITFLWRAAGKPAASAAAPVETQPYDDFRAAADWAYEKGVIDGSFQYDAECTRSSTVAYMWKAAGSPADAPASSFPDVPAGVNYAMAVNWAVDKGVAQGTDNGTFLPDTTCTRGQIATFLYRAYA